MLGDEDNISVDYTRTQIRYLTLNLCICTLTKVTVYSSVNLILHRTNRCSKTGYENIFPGGSIGFNSMSVNHYMLCLFVKLMPF